MIKLYLTTLLYLYETYNMIEMLNKTKLDLTSKIKY